jgi:hypothetical protein
MGGFFEFRDFLLLLFRHCFLTSLPEGTEFCVCLVDLMQFLPGMVLSKTLHQEGFNSEAITRRISQQVTHYQNNEEDPLRPLVRTALVVMLDTVHQVPKTKAATQKDRDQTEDPHMNEERYQELVGQSPPGELFIDSNARRHPLKGSEVWRSVNLKLQLYRLITLQLLHSEVMPGKALIIDDGLAFSTEVYRAMREEMVRENDFSQRSAFEQECLVSHLMTHSHEVITRFILWERGLYRRWPATGTGEADIKILHYINRGNGARRFLVVNQDTDVIFILLLHMQRLLPEGDEEDVEVWLDTHSPGNTSGVNKPYRYINIKRLYFDIVALFAKEYASVPHPVEMFCFLVFSKRTDFIPPFADSLQVKDGDLWNLFSELHHNVENPGGYLQFSTKVLVRVTDYRWSSGLRGLLNYAVTYNWVQQRFLLNHALLQKFYYLLLQDKVMTTRRRLRLPTLTISALNFGTMPGPGRADALEPEELLIYAHDVAERVEAYRRYHSQNESTMFQTLLNFKKRDGPPLLEGEKRYKLSESFGKRSKPVIGVKEEEEDPIEECGEEMDVERASTRSSNTEPNMERYVRQNGDVLKLFTKYAYKQFYGMPTVREMRARIYRLELYLNYCRDGWAYGEAMASLPTQRSRLDDRLSVWGYCERRLSHPEERRKALNSSYYVSRYAPENENLFELWEIVETPEVSHKRYTEQGY